MSITLPLQGILPATVYSKPPHHSVSGFVAIYVGVNWEVAAERNRTYAYHIDSREEATMTDSSDERSRT